MQNLKRNWLVILTLTWGIGWILTQALESLKNVHFNVLLMSKVCIAWAKKVQRSYLSWNWRGIQNLERNRLVVTKLGKGLWQILTWALETLNDFHFNGLLLIKVYVAWAKKVQRSNCSWNWRRIQNLDRNRLVVSKLAEGIWQNLTGALESLKDFHFNGIPLSKVYIAWAKKEQRNNLSCNWRGTQNLERNRLANFKIDIRSLTNFDLSTRKSPKFSF